MLRANASAVAAREEQTVIEELSVFPEAVGRIGCRSNVHQLLGPRIVATLDALAARLRRLVERTEEVLARWQQRNFHVASTARLDSCEKDDNSPRVNQAQHAQFPAFLGCACCTSHACA